MPVSPPPRFAFYEAHGLIESERNQSGHRRYRADALRRVAFIRVAQRIGLSLGEVAEALGSLPSKRTPTRDDWNKLSSRWLPRIDEQIAALGVLRDRLDGCIGCGCLSLDTCELYNMGDRAARARHGRSLSAGGSDRGVRRAEPGAHQVHEVVVVERDGALRWPCSPSWPRSARSVGARPRRAGSRTRTGTPRGRPVR